MFIQLHYIIDGTICFIDKNKIFSINEDQYHGSDIQGDGCSIQVKESPEEVFKLINKK